MTDPWALDLCYQGHLHLIATGVLETSEGLLLVDPGPETTLDALAAGLEARGAALADVRAVLVTHIHLDHAGAAGRVAQLAPEAVVYVHARGARHLEDPARLLRSAERLYGDAMERLWGAMRPIDADRLRVLEGGETLTLGGRTLQTAYTPGHAVHHVSYFDDASGTAFVGDTAGMRVPGEGYVLPQTPPPDVDVEAWGESLARIRAWSPERLFVTHSGPSEGAAAHLDAFEERLAAWAARVRAEVEAGDDPDAAAQRFHEDALAAARPHVSDAAMPAYERFGQPRMSWHGLARHVRRTRRAS